MGSVKKAFKKVTKPFKSVAKAVTKSVSSVFKAVTKPIKSIVKEVGRIPKNISKVLTPQMPDMPKIPDQVAPAPPAPDAEQYAGGIDAPENISRRKRGRRNGLRIDLNTGGGGSTGVNVPVG